MKKRLLVPIIGMALALSAQTTLSPTNLIQPGHNQLQWDIPLNLNFALLNNYLGGNLGVPEIVMQGPLALGSGTISQLPTSIVNGRFTVTNALNPDNCLVGGGANKIDCIGDGATWAPYIAFATPGTSAPGTAGQVYGINCPGSAIASIGDSGSTACAASSTGGNGGLYNSAPTGSVAGVNGYQTKYTYSLVGNTLSTVGGLDFYCGLRTATTGAFINWFLGSQGIPGGIDVTATSDAIIGMHVHLYNQGALNSQWYVTEVTISNVSTGAVSYINLTANNLSVDTTANQSLTCQIDQASTGTNAGGGFYVNRAQQ